MPTAVRCLLLALLLSASVDDLWAVATPDPSDDVTATEDNEYPPVARKQPERRPQDTVDTHRVVVGQGDASQAASALLSGRSPDTDARPFYCPELLYLLRSLQR
jgi:hypothetical protein